MLMYVSYLKMAHDVSVNWSVSPYTVHWIQTPQNILVHTSVCYKTIMFNKIFIIVTIMLRDKALMCLVAACAVDNAADQSQSVADQ